MHLIEVINLFAVGKLNLLSHHADIRICGKDSLFIDRFPASQQLRQKRLPYSFLHGQHQSNYPMSPKHLMVLSI